LFVTWLLDVRLGIGGESDNSSTTLRLSLSGFFDGAATVYGAAQTQLPDCLLLRRFEFENLEKHHLC
jgi:hypothetical protein